MYFDVENELGVELKKRSINLHHFRSSTLKKEAVTTNKYQIDTPLIDTSKNDYSL